MTGGPSRTVRSCGSTTGTDQTHRTDITTLMTMNEQAQALPQPTNTVDGPEARSLYNPDAPRSDLAVSDPSPADAFAAYRRKQRDARWWLFTQMVALALGAFVLNLFVGGVTGQSPADREAIRIYTMAWPFAVALIEGLMLLRIVFQPLDVR